jgi:hypothetical protein
LKIDAYVHFFLYPNAFVSSVEGKGFYLGFLLPESPNVTNLRVRYFEPILEDILTDSNQNILNFFIQSSHESLFTVLNEDKKIIEKIQSNLHSVEHLAPIFGQEEFRINNFYDYFKSRINEFD